MEPYLMVYMVYHCHTITWNPIWWSMWSTIVTPLHGTLSDGLRGLTLSHHYMEPYLMVYMVYHCHTITWNPIWWSTWSNIVTPLHVTLSDGLRGLTLSHHYMEPYLMVYMVYHCHTITWNPPIWWSMWSTIVTPLHGTLSDGLHGLTLSHHYM